MQRIAGGRSAHSASRIYEGSKVLTQDPNSPNYYLFNELFDITFKPVKDLLVEKLLFDARQCEISKNPFEDLPRELKQMIFNFFKKL